MKELPKAYEPNLYEDKIYERWEQSGFFNPDNLTGEPYSIMMPPPNVTGVLHLGHALENSLMDVMARYQRMQGKKVLLLPGTDHAAVATQARVEKNLVEAGMKNPREELGREGLLEKIREYSEQSKSTILKQVRKMGTSADWSRLAYTFDEDRSKAVNEAFVKMYNDGLIYRGYRVVNWSVKGQSTCSDDELVYVDRKAKLYTFKYSADFPFTIATTRPETKLGDTAVAVNPDDERYKQYIGKIFAVNFCGVDLKLKVIADEHVDKEFGTGALGVTPAHSSVDFEMYEKKRAEGDEIDLIKVIGEDGKMTAQAGADFVGLKVLEAREKVVEKLKEAGLFVSEEDIEQSVGTSDRFGDVVESLPMTQWFVAVNKEIPGRGKTLKQLMKDAVAIGHNGDSGQKIKITPDRFEKVYYNWIDNLRDWCISRQIWWGHRIPVWYKKSNKPVMITFLRHGESQANLDKVCAGHLDSPLTENGRESAAKIAEKITTSEFDVVFSSDLVRASETAEIVFGNTQKEIILDSRLREIDFGDFTGSANKGDEVDTLRVSGFPGGENYQQVRDRAIIFLSEILDKYPGKRIAVVAHSGTWKVFENIVKGTPLSCEHLKIHATREPVEYVINDLVYSGVEKLQGENWQQDSDTLDTWFSSGLWTFSTLDWPQDKFAKQKEFHPTLWMQMGHEILFFWMARMILFSTYLLDEIPFKDVYIHGILRDKNGQKFSKSAKNGIDPLEVIEKYGTDALRLSMLSGITPGNDARFYLEKVEGGQHLVNKLWNIARFMSGKIQETNSKLQSDIKIQEAEALSDKWILSRLAEVIKQVTSNIENFQFSQAGEILRDFTWSELADWYLEIVKIEGNKSEILNYILNTLLKLWHPFMPFVTEQIWSEIYGEDKMLMVERWPSFVKASEGKPVDDFNIIQDIITSIRSFRADYKIEPVKKLDVVISAGDRTELLKENVEVIKVLARLENLQINQSTNKPLNSVGIVVGSVEVFIDLSGVVDVAKETARLTEEVAEAKKYVVVLENKLGNSEFVNNAPEAVVEKEQQKLIETKEKLVKLEGQLSNLR